MSALQTFKKLTIQELKQLICHVDGTSLSQKYNLSIYPLGLPSGKIVEVTGFGKTDFMVHFLREYPKFRTVWIEKEFTISPFAVWQNGVDLKKVLFIETQEVNWTLQQILQSQIFEVIVLSIMKFEEKDLRKFQLALEKTNGFIFLLNDRPHKSWVPALQLEVFKRDESLTVETLRKRGFS